MNMNREHTSSAKLDRVTLSLANWIAILAVAGSFLGWTEWKFTSLAERMEEKLAQQTATFQAQYHQQAKIIADQHMDIHELDKRITRREANAFTAQQANDLSNNVTRLSAEMIAAQSALSQSEKSRQELADKLDDLLSVKPADILEELREWKQQLLLPRE